MCARHTYDIHIHAKLNRAQHSTAEYSIELREKIEQRSQQNNCSNNNIAHTLFHFRVKDFKHFSFLFSVFSFLVSGFRFQLIFKEFRFDLGCCVSVRRMYLCVPTHRLNDTHFKSHHAFFCFLAHSFFLHLFLVIFFFVVHEKTKNTRIAFALWLIASYFLDCVCYTVHHLSRYCNNALPLFSIQWKLKQNRENRRNEFKYMILHFDEFLKFSSLDSLHWFYASATVPANFMSQCLFQQTAPFSFHIRNLERTMENLFSPRITSLKIGLEFGFQSIFVIFFYYQSKISIKLKFNYLGQL